MAFYGVKVGSFHLGWGKEAYTDNLPLTPNLMNLSGTAQWENITNENAYRMYLTTPEVFSVVKRRGFMLAAGVWKHYRIKRDGSVEEIKKSPYVTLLENPNPLMSGNDFLRQWNENDLVHGNNFMSTLFGFDQEFRALNPVPTALYNLPPSRVEIRTTGKIFRQTTIDGIIETYRLRLDGPPNYDDYNPKEIIHTKNITGSNPIVGDSPLITLFMEIGNIRAAKEFRNVLMKKKGALGILSNKSGTGNGAVPITQDEVQRIERQYRDQYGIDDRQIQVMISRGALEWQAMSFPTKDMMLFEEVSADFRTIIDLYGLNDMLFSREKATTFTNLMDALKHAFQNTTIPDAEERSMTLSKHLGLVDKNEFLSLEYDHLPILQKNQKEKAEELNLKANAVKKLQETGIYSDIELREIGDFDTTQQ